MRPENIDESSICGSVKIEPRQRIHSLTADKKQRQVVISRSAANGIISYSKALHPNEGILILQGKTTKEQIIIDTLDIPIFICLLTVHTLAALTLTLVVLTGRRLRILIEDFMVRFQS